MDARARIQTLLAQIYGAERGADAWRRLQALLTEFPPLRSEVRAMFSPQEIVLITYGDSLHAPAATPLQTLHAFAHRYLRDIFSAIHFLPFFPYSSDDGFAVMDYFTIDPALGDWADLQRFKPEFRLMLDWVVNHISAQSAWFRNYLADTPGFADLAIEVDPACDLRRVIRPRSLPLLTPFIKHDGRQVHLWTTFSADQVDLNFRSLDVLLDQVRVMLTYVAQGADILRLDAIAYLWKEIGTNCIHLPRTHMLVKLFRAVLDLVAPAVLLLTETNVPHAENISYFGQDGDEAQMVYNFTLPPLLLHSLLTGDATHLRRWVETLSLSSPRTAFFNFTASHDGIGVRPLEGILAAADIQALVDSVRANGGDVSFRDNPDGTQSPYELNITFVDALKGAGPGGDAMHARRFLASQAVSLTLPGVPAVYIHSLLGSRNWYAGVRQSGRARSINRAKLAWPEVGIALHDADSFRARIFWPYCNMLKVRRRQPAFHPKAECEVLPGDPRLLALVRRAPAQTIWAFTNVSSAPVGLGDLGRRCGRRCVDLLTGKRCEADTAVLAPYQAMWLTV
jgi:glycosidase